jgi:hypothetical protein
MKWARSWIFDEIAVSGVSIKHIDKAAPVAASHAKMTLAGLQLALGSLTRAYLKKRSPTGLV